MTGSTEHSADAERRRAEANKLYMEIQHAVSYSHGIEIAEKVLQERDTALRDAETLRADLKLHQGMHAVTIGQYEALRGQIADLQQQNAADMERMAVLHETNEALREEVGRLREGLIPKPSPRPPFVIDPEYAADTKSLRHPLTGDTVVYVSTEPGRILETRTDDEIERAVTDQFMAELHAKTRPAASRDGIRLAPLSDEKKAYLRDLNKKARDYDPTTIIGGPQKAAASGEDVEWARELRERILDAVRDSPKVAIGMYRSVLSGILDPIIIDALTAARLSGRAEMAKLDEPVIAAARRLKRAWQKHKDGAPSHAVFHAEVLLGNAMDEYDRTVATRDAALKALPEDVR